MSIKHLLQLTFILALGLTTSACAHSHRSHTHVHTVKTVAVAPVGAVKVVHRGKKYWVHDGVVYRKKKNTYHVVTAPVGMHVTVLPKGHSTKVIKGKTYYVAGGNYWQYNVKKKRYVVVKVPV